MNSILNLFSSRRDLSSPIFSDQSDNAIKLISEKKWDEVSKTLPYIKFQSILNFNVKCSKDCTSCHGLLHHACRFQPPLFIVKKIINNFSEDVYELDCLNRLPLHIAIENGASFDVVNYLLRINPYAANRTCYNDNYPLHLAFLELRKKLAELSENEEQKAYMRNLNKILNLLCRTSPTSIQSKNNDGLTPFDIAIQEHAFVDKLSILWKFDKCLLDPYGFKKFGLYEVKQKKFCNHIVYLLRTGNGEIVYSAKAA